MGKNFIELDQFLKIPKHVQEDIIELWQPQTGDLFCTNHRDLSVVLTTTDKFILTLCGDNIKRNKAIPLLNETQVRRMIENKLHVMIDILYDYNDTDNELFEITFSLYETAEDEDFNNIDNYTFKVEDLLDGYWQLLQKTLQGEI